MGYQVVGIIVAFWRPVVNRKISSLNDNLKYSVKEDLG